uniref:Uncharacterized protein n=1 Tax=Lepeophtheirus salmonis TaxID=72036 RepID=A0A0K2US41_LEPSM
MICITTSNRLFFRHILAHNEVEITAFA